MRSEIFLILKLARAKDKMRECKHQKETSRLFFGSFIDAENLDYNRHQGAFIDYFGKSIKPVKAENIHLTWKFIGDADEELTGKLIEAVSSMNLADFKVIIKFTEFQIWQNKRNPRQIILKGFDIDGKGGIFHKSLNSVLKKTGVNEEKRAFNPHITFARFKNIENFPKEIILPDTSSFAETICEIKSLCLVKSSLTPNGSEYEVLKEFGRGF